MAVLTLANWQARMSEDMRLADYRERTQEAYILATRQFLEHLQREPGALGENDVRAYFLYLRDERKLSPSYLNIAVCGLRFFFQRTLRQDMDVFDLLRVKKPERLPVVLSPGEVRAILSAIRLPVRRMALTTLYALGLRLGEGLRLECSHIDGQRLRVWIRDGKGAKDRTVPLPRPLLDRLRLYWKHERPPSTTKYLFVARNADKALDETTLQKTFTAALTGTAIQKHATIHTLRHSYATHLVEAGVSLRTVQEILGHASLRTTEVYLHVTTVNEERVQSAVDALMTGLLDFGATAMAGAAPTSNPDASSSVPLAPPSAKRRKPHPES